MLTDALVLAGVAMLAAGAWLLSPAAGLAVAGLFCLAVGLGHGRDGEKHDNRRG